MWHQFCNLIKLRNFKYNTKLTTDDIVLLKELLNYCWHRSYKHQTPISWRAKQIDVLRLKFCIIENSKYKRSPLSSQKYVS